jgi:hypothetical protein
MYSQSLAKNVCRSSKSNRHRPANLVISTVALGAFDHVKVHIADTFEPVPNLDHCGRARSNPASPADPSRRGRARDHELTVRPCISIARRSRHARVIFEHVFESRTGRFGRRDPARALPRRASAPAPRHPGRLVAVHLHTSGERTPDLSLPLSRQTAASAVGWLASHYAEIERRSVVVGLTATLGEDKPHGYPRR